MKLKSIALVSLLLLASCIGGSKDQPHQRVTKTQMKLDIDSLIEGQYLAVFETLNPQITSKISGAFTFSVEKFL